MHYSAYPTLSARPNKFRYSFRKLSSSVQPLAPIRKSLASVDQSALHNFVPCPHQLSVYHAHFHPTPSRLRTRVP